MDRENAWALVKEYSKSQSLLRHSIAVGAFMRGYAHKVGERMRKLGDISMLHEFDWDVCSSEQRSPQFGAALLRARGYPDVIVRVILSHGNHTGVSGDSVIGRALFAMDELSGFVTTVALVRSTKSLSDTDSRAVRKKMKYKPFAPNVSRYDLAQGAKDLGVALDKLIEFVAESLNPVASHLGLATGGTSGNEQLRRTLAGLNSATT